jgi:hypothetical protein
MACLNPIPGHPQGNQGKQTGGAHEPEQESQKIFCRPWLLHRRLRKAIHYQVLVQQ